MDFQKLRGACSQEKVENIEGSSLGGRMQRGVPFEVLLQKLFDKNCFSQQRLDTQQGVMLASCVKDGLVLEVPQIEVGTAFPEVLEDHVVVILDNGIV